MPSPSWTTVKLYFLQNWFCADPTVSIRHFNYIQLHLLASSSIVEHIVNLFLREEFGPSSFKVLQNVLDS